MAYLICGLSLKQVETSSNQDVSLSGNMFENKKDAIQALEEKIMKYLDFYTEEKWPKCNQAITEFYYKIS